MSWIPGAEQRYYNPTTNRVPAAIFTNHFEPALEDAQTHNRLVGIDTDRDDDAITPWLGISAKVVSVPIQPVTEITLPGETSPGG